MGFFVRRGINRKKREPRRRLLDLSLTIAALLASISAVYVERNTVASIANRLSGSLLGHSYFSVREIKVRGGKKFGGNEIVAMAKLRHGMSIWKVEPEAIETKVERHPWVKEVLVRRELPDRVVINVTERAAKGIVFLGTPYYVDGDGFLFKPVGDGEKMDFPLLTGLKQEDFVSRTVATRRRIREVLRLSNLMKRRSLALSEIHFTPRDGVIFYPMAHPVALRMGWGDWEEKMQRMDRVLGVWQGKEDRLAVLDFSFRDQVVARTKKTSG